MKILPEKRIPKTTAKSLRQVACAFPLLAIAALPSHGFAATLVHGQYNNNPAPSASGYTTSSGALYIVGGKSEFNGNGFDGFNDGNAPIIVLKGEFNGNGNAGLQDTAVTSKSAIINGGSFDSNVISGIDVYSQLTVNGGDFAKNGGYGVSTHFTATLNAGTFDNNGLFDVAVFGGTTSVYGGTYAAPLAGQATFATIGSASGIVLYGSFNEYGTFSSNLSFTGTLAKQTVSQSFTYTNFGGSITLAQSPTAFSTPVNPVPEAPTEVLFAAGLLPLLVAYRRAAKARANETPALKT